MPAADSALRDWPGSRRRARCPSTMRVNVPVAGGQILLDLTRAVCGMSALQDSSSGSLSLDASGAGWAEAGPNIWCISERGGRERSSTDILASTTSRRVARTD